MKTTSHRRIRGLGHRPGLHEPEPRLRRAAAARRRRTAAAAALDLGVTLFDTAALYGFGANETLVGRVLKPHRARIHAGQQVRHGRGDGDDGGSASSTAGPRRSAQLRGQPAAAADRRHRPLLPAPLGQERADRGQRRRAGRPGRSGKVRAHRPVRSLGHDPAPRACRAPDRARCRPNIRCGRATPRSPCCRPAGSSAPPSSPSARRPRLPHRHAARRVDAATRRTSAAACRASSPKLRRQPGAARWLPALRRRSRLQPAQLALAWLLAQGDAHRADTGHDQHRAP